METNFCVTCSHYIGGGDWNLCCELHHDGYPFGFLCYEDTKACEMYKEDHVAKRAFIAGTRMSNKVKINIYDQEEVHKNCTVQILKNTVTGDVSVGWIENEGRE